MPDTLNLAGADTTGPDFDPVPTGWYVCIVAKIEDKFTKGGPEAALPAGTPMMNVHLRIKEGTVITDPETGSERNVSGKYVFKQLVIPPAKIDGKPYEHHKKMMGQVASFFINQGIPEEVVMGGEFDTTDYSQFYGNEIGVRIRRYKNTYKGEWDNDVQAFKPADQVSVGSSETAGIV